MMSLPLNQTNPQLNDLLLRGGSSLSPELKEQAIDDILAEFGSAPTKKAAKQAVPAQKQPALAMSCDRPHGSDFDGMRYRSDAA